MELFPFSAGCKNKDSCDPGKLIIIIRNLARQIKLENFYTWKFSNNKWDIIYRTIC